MKTYQRSLRLMQDLEEKIDTLPPKSVNGLINNLLALFFENKAIQDMIRLKDSKFTEWEPDVDKTVPKVVINPAADLAPPTTPQVEKPVESQSVLDEIVPD